MINSLLFRYREVIADRRSLLHFTRNLLITKMSNIFHLHGINYNRVEPITSPSEGLQKINEYNMNE